MKDIYVKRFIFDDDVRYLSSSPIKLIICQEWKSTLPIPKHIEVIFSESKRAEGTHLAYQYNETIADSLIKKVGIGLIIDGISLKPVITKLLYWSNYKIGALKLFTKEYSKERLLDKTKYFENSYSKALLKYLKYIIQSRIRRYDNEKIIKPVKSYKLAIIVNHQFELFLYKNLINELEPGTFLLLHYGNVKFDILKEKHHTFNIKFTSDAKPILINPFKLNREELNALNLIYKDFNHLASEVKIAKFIRDLGINKLLINEGENLPHRKLLKFILGNQVKIYNTMNGVKGGEAQDIDVNFDKWFVWDDEMKNYMIEKTGLPEEMFIVTGHLTKDNLENHQVQNLLNLPTEELKDRILIVVFSVRGRRPEKMETFEKLLEFCRSHSNIHLVIKPHPHERPEDQIYTQFVDENKAVVPNNLVKSKEVVYDLLKMADLVISFYSTISIECSWIQTPCLNIDYKPQQSLYYKDPGIMFHIKSSAELDTFLQNNLKKKPINTMNQKSEVAKKVAAELQT